MKTTSLIQVASERRMTIDRAAHEVLCAAGVEARIYPTRIRKQHIPDCLLNQARWCVDRQNRWSGYSPLNGPKRQLP